MNEGLQVALVIVGTVASVGTCTFVIFMFRRLFANHDKLAQGIEGLTKILNDFKLEVSDKYIQTSHCMSCKQEISRWKDNLKKDCRDFEQRVNDRLREGDRQITRLETIFEMKEVANADISKQ